MSIRDLTEEELKLAPNGFNEYGFNRSGKVFFFNRELGCAVIDGVDEVLNLSLSHYAYDECRPIPKPKKPFDISEHELINYGYIGINKHDKSLYVKENGFTIDRERAVAIAKALGVTGEDLK